MTFSKKRIKKLYAKIKKQSLNPVNPMKKGEYLKIQAKKMSKKLTWPEKEFVKMMKELKVECEPQKIVGEKIFDFFLPDYNMLFEVDGDYWHGNREIYAEHNGMQRKNAKNDSYKNTLAKGYGYKIERVWESDLKKNYEDVKKRIKKLLK